MSATPKSVLAMEETLEILEQTQGGYYIYDEELQMFLRYGSLAELEEALIIYKEMPVELENDRVEMHEQVMDALDSVVVSGTTMEKFYEYKLENAMRSA